MNRTVFGQTPVKCTKNYVSYQKKKCLNKFEKFSAPGPFKGTKMAKNQWNNQFLVIFWWIERFLYIEFISNLSVSLVRWVLTYIWNKKNQRLSLYHIIILYNQIFLTLNVLGGILCPS